jgi:hypothetical protein
MLRERPENGDWLALWERHGVGFAVLNRQEDGDLATRLLHDPSWAVRHEAEGVIFFERRPAPEGKVRSPTDRGRPLCGGQRPPARKEKGAGGCTRPPAPQLPGL